MSKEEISIKSVDEIVTRLTQKHYDRDYLVLKSITYNDDNTCIIHIGFPEEFISKMSDRKFMDFRRDLYLEINKLFKDYDCVTSVQKCSGSCHSCGVDRPYKIQFDELS